MDQEKRCVMCVTCFLVSFVLLAIVILQEKSNGGDTTTTKVKDWIPLYVVMDFEDHNKQKKLVVEVVLFVRELDLAMCFPIFKW